MSKRRGFTVVELVVVMVIMAILLGLGFTVVTRSQKNARDAERQADVEAIARGLETRYKQGNPKLTTPIFYIVAGSYPGIYEIRHMRGTNLAGSNPPYNPAQVLGGYGPDLLPGTNEGSFIAPGKTAVYDGFFPVCDVVSCDSTLTPSSAAVTNSVSADRYLYVPIDADGNICTVSSCVRFDLYWRKESDGSLQKIESKRR